MTHPNKTLRSLRKVVVVFKTHFDLGFTDLPDTVMSTYTGPMFEAVRDVMKATAGEQQGFRYSWTLPAWPLRQLLHDPALPEETRAAARELVEQGRLSWHAWPFTTHTAFCGLEDLVRGLHVSRSLSEEFGVWPHAAKQTDVPGHTWIFPSMLVRAGVRFLHLGCNPGSHSPHVPRLFWWEGPDGARLLTWYSHGGYGSSLLPPGDWDLDTWLAVQQTSDNLGPQSPEELSRIRVEIEEGAPGVEVLFGRLEDFAGSLLEHPAQLEDLPVVPFDLADTWIHGVGSMPREVARVRELRAKLPALESIVAARDWPREGYTADTTDDFLLARQLAPHIDAAYEQLMLFGEHTWGLDVKSTIKRAFGEEFAEARKTEPYERLESSWAAKAIYIDRAEAAYRQALGIAQEALGSQPGTAEAAEEDPLASQATGGGLPENVIENEWFRVEVDSGAGGIVSLLDKRTGRDWVDHHNPEPFGGYRYDLYSGADIGEFLRAYGPLLQEWFVNDFGKAGYPEETERITSYACDFTLSRSHDSREQSIIMSGGKLRALDISPGVELPRQIISIKITLGTGRNPLIELEYRVQGKEATPLAESTVVPFPLDLPKASFRLGQAGSVIDPARDIAAGANRGLWCVEGWVDASDDRVGLAVLPVDMPLVSIGNTGIFSFEPERVAMEPVLYAHLSNTQWGTNFPQWLEGDFNFRVKLMPHAGDWREADLCMHTALTRDIYLPLAGEGDSSELPIKDPWGLVLKAVRPRHDGGGLILRYWDAVGLHRKVTLYIEGPVARLWRCDLMERPSEELPLTRRGTSSCAELAVAPHAIETLLVEFGGHAEASR